MFRIVLVDDEREEREGIEVCIGNVSSFELSGEGILEISFWGDWCG